MGFGRVCIARFLLAYAAGGERDVPTHRAMSPSQPTGTVACVTYHSFYRRYRPQRFADVLGQDHISNTLRNAVRTGKVAHAYLFSGPRGCGKTTSARILAKALNCTDLQDGEPCGVCDSCTQVASGASLDVNELDAASNNGVEAMRDLVSRAALGTPGRRKVYIVDEVHMLSTAASNALLKTLEEPPDHVVFVLATTDPQKVLPTIRSRTQHFEFRLFSLPTLEGLLRGVAQDAGLELDDATIEAVARRGNGSARDALSALDQVAAAGAIDDSFDLTELTAGLAARDAAAVLSGVDHACDHGRDPRQLARDLIEALREVFLAHMGVGDRRADVGLARALGPAAVTRGIEVLGDALVTMRDALDPRVTLEVALIRLVRADLDTSTAAILERLERLERGSSPGVATPVSVAPVSVAPVSQPAAPTVLDAPVPLDGSTVVREKEPTVLPPLTVPPSDRAAPAVKGRGAADQARAVLGARPAARMVPVAEPASLTDVPVTTPIPGPAADVSTASSQRAPVALSSDALNEEREPILERLERRAKVVFTAGRFLSADATSVVFGLPNAMHLDRCREWAGDLERAVRAATATDATLQLVVDTSAADVSENRANEPLLRVVPGEPTGEELDIDLTDLTDAPSVAAPTMLDHLTSAFPGAEVVDDTFLRRD